MKKFLLIFLYLLVGFSFSAHATNHNHIIADKTDKCKIHYLAPTTKKLWYIQTDNTCPNGWVEGFSDVELFDLFDTKKETVSCFFKQGYCLDQFVKLETVHKYGTLEPSTKTLSFLTDTDTPSDTQYFALFRSEPTKTGVYPAFSLCRPNAYFLVVHPQAEDFKNTAFQGRIFKQIHQTALHLCPHASELVILGALTANANGNDWIFRADMDLSKETTDVRYRTVTPEVSKSNKPDELRTEQSEVVVSVTSSSPNTIRAEYGTPRPQPTPQSPPTDQTDQSWNYTNYNYSILDLAILANIAPQPIQGKAIVHIASIALDGTGTVDKPAPAILSQATDVKPGWARIQGLFTIQNNQLMIKPLSVKHCSQEWCHEK